MESITELTSLISDPTTDSELRSLAKEDLDETNDKLINAAQGLRSSLVPPHPFAHLPCLIEIRPGAGGSEAAIFANDLFRMYQSFCNRSGYRTNLLKYENVNGGTEATVPLSEAVFEVENVLAYGIFRSEAGVHR